MNLMSGCRKIAVLANLSLVRLTALLLIGVLLTTSDVVSRSVEVVQSDASTFHFRVVIDPNDLDWLTEEDSTYTGYKTIQIGLPYGAQPILQVAQGDDARILPDGIVGPPGLSKIAYPVASLGKPNTFRGRQIVGLRVYPVISGSVFSQIEIKVVFQGGVSLKTTAPNDPIFERIFGAVVANYDQFKSWPVGPGTAPKSLKVLAGPFADGGPWVRMSVNQTGLHRVTGSALANVSASVIGSSSGSLQLFSGGGFQLPVHNDSARPVLTEIPILVEDGGDGVFDQGDRILFFGEPDDRWIFEAGSDPRFVEQHYTDGNVYWLHVSTGSSGLRMSGETGTAGGTPLSRHPAWMHVEQNNMLYRNNDGTMSDYYTWYWSDEENLSFFVSTPSLTNDDSATVRLTGVAWDYDLTINNASADRVSCGTQECIFRSAALVDGANQIDLTLTPTYISPPYFDYIEFSFPALNEPQNNRLDLTIGPFTGSFEVEVVNSFPSTPLVLNVSDPMRPTRITGVSVQGDWITFDIDSDSSVFARYYVATADDALTPSAIEAAAPVDLYATDQQADVIVIAPSSLMGALDEFVEFRRTEGFTVRTATVEDVMDNFAFGLYDPTAIRDFLKYAYENYPSPAPATVLLVGDANYDYLNYTKTDLPNYVPAYLHAVYSRSSDDDYVYFGSYGLLDSDTSYDVPDDRGFDMTISRWPVRTPAEIGTITSKIINYESAANFGIWRNSITLVADDEYTRSSSTEWIHTVQTEELANEHIPALFNRDKIYCWEYPFVNWQKPEVNDAIVRAFNEGRLIVNYVGHGNPDVWAHEHVFVRSDYLPLLSNISQLPLVFVASCAIGFFDDPLREVMAEDLLAMSNGGAIGTISAIRSVSSSSNAQFNQAVFDFLFAEPSLSIAEAMYAAKIARQYASGEPRPNVNDRLFLYFGDPCCRLAVPQLGVEFTSAPDTLVALATTRVSGRIVDDEQNTYSGNGVLYVHVFDSEREKIYRLVNSDGVVIQEIPYTVAGPTIYRGSATITSGQFSFEFLPPLDIGYGGTGACVSVYASFDDIDGAGIADSIAVSDSIVVLADSVGPNIDISFVGRTNFVSGDYIGDSEQMQITLSDPSGVNLTGAVGHGITLEIDNQSENMINLTPLFESGQDDYTTGSLLYPIEELQPGNHHFKVKAWDNANNSSSMEFDAEVMAAEGLTIRGLLNYPNPMKESTRFSFYLTQATEKFSLELFTLSGRKIKSFYRYSLDPGYYDDIEWYGRDTDGSRVATEVYIYKATAYPASGGDKAESIGKLVLIN